MHPGGAPDDLSLHQSLIPDSASMRLPPLPIASDSHIYARGDIRIDPSAVLAPGSILQAAPGSHIAIGAGVCIGMGCVLNAYQGTIEIERGATLGPGVLIIGSCKIGAHACLGAATTVFNAVVEALQMIPTTSLLGDVSRQVELSPTLEAKSTETLGADTAPDLSPSSSESEAHDHDDPSQSSSAAAAASANPSQREQAPIFGQTYVNQLLVTLFPGGHSLHHRSQDQD
ncbi:MAG: hypothetical protein F6K19_18470 [Cyanothece sp. SIO1E1]|nr:hypothetical protein [Cyanothece sp. SIO1E1]